MRLIVQGERARHRQWQEVEMLAKWVSTANDI